MKPIRKATTDHLCNARNGTYVCSREKHARGAHEQVFRAGGVAPRRARWSGAYSEVHFTIPKPGA